MVGRRAQYETDHTLGLVARRIPICLVLGPRGGGTHKGWVYDGTPFK